MNKGNKFYNRSIIKWLKDNDIELYSTLDEGKSVVVEKFIRTLKNKSLQIYDYSIKKRVY